MFKLNLGAGPHPLPGYTNIDINTTGEHVYPLEYPADTADEIRASHVLEHFSHREVGDVLKEWVRVLKPGGLLKIAVPDFEWICQAFTNGRGTDLPLQGYLMGGQVDEYDFHKAVFTAQSLGDAMRAAGCTRLAFWKDEDIMDCSNLPVSLNLQGIKGQPQGEPIVIAGAMSLPQEGPIIAQYSVQQLGAAMGIPIYHGYGVMWHHALTRSIDQARSFKQRVPSQDLHEPAWKEPDFILTIDYDSIFQPKDVGYLAALLHDNPDVDVVVPMQMKREGGPLLAASSTGVDLRSDLVKIETGHFGLTLFRRPVFERLPKPWFYERPDPDGGWGEGRMDSDIGFWDNCRNSGINVYLATQCRIGHLEKVVTWPMLTPQGVEPYYQKTTEWVATRRPPSGV